MNAVNQILRMVNEQCGQVFSEEQQPVCIGCAAAKNYIRELEHQHRNDEAANRMLSDTCSRLHERIRQLEGR